MIIQVTYTLNWHSRDISTYKTLVEMNHPWSILQQILKQEIKSAGNITTK